MRLVRSSVRVLALLLSFTGIVAAQVEGDDPPSTRIEAMERARAEKAAHLTPAELDPIEAKLERVMEMIQPNGGGWSVMFGGLRPGSGFALGPRYRKDGLLDDNLKVDFAAVGSYRLYYGVALGLNFDRLLDDRMTVDYAVRRLDSPSLEYYGPGNDSDDDRKTNYRMEEFGQRVIVGFKPVRRHFAIGAVGEHRRINVGPGKSGASPSADTLYTPLQAPGIDRQTTFWMGGPYAELNTLDSDGDPHAGTYVFARYGWADDRNEGPYSFRYAETTVEQYAPFLNKKRYFAFRARGRWSFVDPGNTLPFYLQPTLGGPNDLRSYPRFRFYDNNSLLFNGEYRWEVAPALDMAVFTDWGKVFSTPGDMALRDLHGGGGFGLRFKSRDSVIMRIDLAVGQEGFGFAWSFGNIFQRYSSQLLQ